MYEPEPTEPLHEIVFWLVACALAGVVATLFTVAAPIVMLAGGNNPPDWFMIVTCVPAWLAWSIGFWNHFRS